MSQLVASRIHVSSNAYHCISTKRTKIWRDVPGSMLLPNYDAKQTDISQLNPGYSQVASFDASHTGLRANEAPKSIGAGTQSRARPVLTTVLLRVRHMLHLWDMVSRSGILCRHGHHRLILKRP